MAQPPPPPRAALLSRPLGTERPTSAQGDPGESGLSGRYLGGSLFLVGLTPLPMASSSSQLPHLPNCVHEPSISRLQSGGPRLRSPAPGKLHPTAVLGRCAKPDLLRSRPSAPGPAHPLRQSAEQLVGAEAGLGLAAQGQTWVSPDSGSKGQTQRAEGHSPARWPGPRHGSRGQGAWASLQAPASPSSSWPHCGHTVAHTGPGRQPVRAVREFAGAGWGMQRLWHPEGGDLPGNRQGLASGQGQRGAEPPQDGQWGTVRLLRPEWTT